MPERTAPGMTAEDIRAAVRALGRDDPELAGKTGALYRVAHADAPRDGIDVVRDIAYGPHERHLLDIHGPRGIVPREARPVIVYFHGGGFIGGDKSDDDHLFWDNIATYFARHGMVVANAIHRLAPDHQWPAGSEDVAAAVDWARAHIAEHGGDPGRIFVMGHSSGASHVAAYAMHKDLRPAAGIPVKGAICLSAKYGPDLDPERRDPKHLAYYGEDTRLWPARATLGHVAPDSPPVYVTVAEFDQFSFQRATMALLLELTERDGTLPRFKTMWGHNHYSTVMHFNTDDDSVGPEIVRFIREHAD